MIYTCSNPATWHPTCHRGENHHNPPKSWTTDAGASSEIVMLCGFCHNEIHALLNEYIRSVGLPPWSVRVTYSPYIRGLAEKAWVRRPNDKPPYTQSDPIH